jgi:glucokinase
MANGDYAIGVDLGGTKIEAAVVDEQGDILQRIRRKTDTEGGARAVESQIVSVVKQLGREFDTAGVGIGVAGQVVRDTGHVRYAPNLDWHDVPLQENLARALNMTVKVTNDVRAITLGEWRFGAGRGCADLICVFVGTGVGGGIVSGGRLLTGDGNTAGEVGHITVDLHGPQCTCGNQGCLESLAGGWAIARQAQKMAATHADAGAVWIELAGGDVADITAETVAEAYCLNHPPSISIIAGVVEALAGGVVSMVNMIGPQRVILGGGVIDGLPELIDRVDQRVRQKALTAATASLQVIPAQLGCAVGSIGAAAMILHAP